MTLCDTSHGSTKQARIWKFNTGCPHDSATSIAVDDIALAKLRGFPIAPAIADLVELAAAAQLVDRLERRPSATRSGDSWSRRLDLTIGVREVDLWRDENITRQLSELFFWLTDDDWNISFVPRVAEVRPSEALLSLFRDPLEQKCIALYSGGLDSLLGLSLDLLDEITPILVSVVSNSRQASCQTETIIALQQEFDRPMKHITIPMNLHGAESLESSHRTRGFGFLALASCVAVAAEINEIRVYENGVGSINLPYSRSQIGAQATRSMHPLSLFRAQELFSTLLGYPLSFINPRQYQTKSQMCRMMPSGLHKIIPKAMSCDGSFSHRATKVPNCGACTSCLLRRQALWGAEMGSLDEETQYRTDVLLSDEPAEHNTYNLKAMLSQVARLDRALNGSNSLDGILIEFPELIYAANALSIGTSESFVSRQLLHMYRQYVNEWRSFPSELIPLYLSTSNEPDKSTIWVT